MLIQQILTRPEARVFQAGPILIIHYFGPASAKSVMSDFDLALPVLEHYGHFSYLVVFESHRIGPPSPQALSSVQARLKSLGNKCLCSALVVRGQGIAPTMMRMVLATAAFVAGDAARRKIFRDVREGLTWLQLFDEQHIETRLLTIEGIEAVLHAPP